MELGDNGPIELMETSPSLLLRIRNPQDQASWQLFTEIYTPVILRFLLRRGLQATDAADVAQEILVEVSKCICDFDYDAKAGRFRDWLYRVTQRQLYRFWRRQKPTQELVEVDIEAVVDAEFIDILHRQILEVAMDRVRAEVEPKTWQVFQATWIENRPASEVALQMNMTIDLVYSAKARFLRRLEVEVCQLGEDSDALESERKS